MGTLTALVLGLLVASAQGSYAARQSEIKQLTAYAILLDLLLDQYGKDAESARVSLRNVGKLIGAERDANYTCPFRKFHPA
jgi:hypothetical protein